ncbi:hypothetical protein ACFL1T_00345 [Chlamydiota bacterium]
MIKRVRIIGYIFLLISVSGFAEDIPKSISFKKFLPFLPKKVADLVPVNDPDGKTTTMGKISVTEVTQEYVNPKNKEQSVTIHIRYNSMLHAANIGMMFPQFEEETTTGYKKMTQIGDYKAMIEYDNKNSFARINVVVGALVVELDGSPLTDEKILLETVKNMDLETLKTLTQ